MTARPDSLVWRGSVEAWGLLVDDTAERRAWLLRRLEPGAAILRTQGGLVLRFASLTRLDTSQAHGLPLCEVHGRLCALPLSAKALDAIGAPPGAVVRAVGGRVVVEPAPEPVDVARWLSLEGWAALPPLDAPPPEPPRLVAPATQPVSLRAFLREPPPPKPAEPTMRALWRAVREWWAARRQPRAAQRAAPTGRGTTAGRAAAPISDTLWERLVRAVQGSALGERLRQRQRDYLSRLNELFERGQLEEALRAAIALGDGGAPRNRTPALGLPTPRKALSPSTSRATDGPSIVLEDEGEFARLRRQYIAAAEELVRQGRFEEAAFVHADLLKQPQAAVSLLERHQKYGLAAQVAEAHELDGGLRVRLWVLAGELGRAVQLARKGHWTMGAALLEADRPDLANALRFAHADTLASSGDFVGAVTVAAPLRGGAPLARRWTELGIAAGGPGAARLLVRRLELFPEEEPQTLAQARAVLATDGAAELDSRRALTDALGRGPESSNAARAALARGAVRTLLRDHALFGAPTQGLLQPLLALDEGALRADLPPHAPGAPPTQLPTRLVFEPDPTAPEAFDAVALGGGRVAVACGELGVRVLGADGRLRARWATPAGRLCGQGNALIALARRTPLSALARLTLAPPQAEHWAHMALSAVDQEVHDGVWFAADGHVLLGLDALAPEPTALHRLELTGRIAALGSDADQLAVLVEGADLTAQLLTFTLPTLAKRSQQLAWNARGIVSAASVGGDGTLALVGTAVDGTPMLWHGSPRLGELPARVLPAPAAGPAAPKVELVAVPLRLASGVEVRLLRAAEASPLTTWFFPGATRVAVRWSGDWLCAAASTGRVVGLHFPTRKLWSSPIGGGR